MNESGLESRPRRDPDAERPAADGTVSVCGSIGPGLCVFVGATHDHAAREADKLAEEMLFGALAKGGLVRIGLGEGALVFEVAPRGAR